MSEHIHADIVQPDGSIGAVSRQRQMKQPRKDVLRDALRAAADRQEALVRERDSWRELAEREPEEATPFPAMTLVIIGGVLGCAFGMALAGWLL